MPRSPFEPALTRRGGRAAPSAGLLRALRDFLIAPADGAGDAHAARGLDRSAPVVPVGSGAPPAIAVVADPADVVALASAVAMQAARVQRAPCALVALHGAPGRAADADAGAGGGFGRPAARRLAASLAARGLPARAAGRVVTVALSGEGESTAVAAAERAFAAAAGAGAVAVVGLGGARAPALDRLIGACDLALALLRPGQEALLELAVAGLAATGAPVSSALVAVTGPARLLATRGVAVAPALRASLEPALEPLHDAAAWRASEARA